MENNRPSYGWSSGFEPHSRYQIKYALVVQRIRILVYEIEDTGSNPVEGTYGSVAQMEEHWDSTPAVIGSNPIGVTI